MQLSTLQDSLLRSYIFSISMLQQSPRLTGICNQRRPGTVRCNCFHGSWQSKIVTVPTASSSYHQGFRWPRMGLRVWNAVLLVCLSFLLAPESMEAFLRPASAYPPLLQALQKGPLKVSYWAIKSWLSLSRHKRPLHAAAQTWFFVLYPHLSLS